MTVFTYTEDPPFEDPEENKKAYYRLPRKILLPPYLENNPYFVQLCEAIDEVFDGNVEAKTLALQQIRDVWATNKGTEQAISEGRMIDFSEWGGADHATNVQQVNSLGLKISTAEAVDDLSYRALAKFVGSYWFGKGKNTAIDFLNFCLGTNITVTPLWTQDYVTFSPYPGDSAEFIFSPGRQSSSASYPTIKHSVVGGWNVAGYSSGVGTSLQQYFVPSFPPDPPAWYPTTHVDINLPTDTRVPTEVIGRLFYEIANYNLVIRNIDAETQSQPIVSAGDDQANIVGIGHIFDELVTPSTPAYPLAYHSKMGGRTGGMGSPMRQVSNVQWPSLT
jgi:hypothetical protein